MTFVWLGSGLLATLAALVAYLYLYGSSQRRLDNDVDIATSPARAFDVFTDFSRWHRIWKQMAEVHPPAAPIEVGSEFWWTQPNGQRVDAEVLRWDRGKCVQLDLRFPDTDQGQRFTMRFEPKQIRGQPACLTTMVNEVRLDRARDRVLVPLLGPVTNLSHRGMLWRLKIEAEAVD
jgi:hypothetical protein